MKNLPRLSIALLCVFISLHAEAQRTVQNFDHDWLFLQSDAADAQSPAAADAAWQKVNLPHDWAIYGPFDAANPSGGAGAFAPAGIGWYRKHFVLPEADHAKRVFIEFDGVMANSDVWINGALLGHRPYGYISFRYELTDHLHFGAENLLAVKADNSAQPASRFYEGAGIYRHVRLIVEDPVHLGQWSTFITTPAVTATAADVRVQTEVVNQSDVPATVSLAINLIAPNGKIVATKKTAAQTIAPAATVPFDAALHLASPDRWDINHPALYRAEVKVLSGKQITDNETVRFGVREFHFDPATGFWLNGRNFKLKGVALHSDVGSLGMAAPLGAWEHRLAAMRKMGANAIRTAHNPVAPDFLDLCDRLGWLVMDEMFDQWTVAKNPYDYHLYFNQWHLADTRDTVRRDRNHPSIILYSAGNEIHDTPQPELAKSILGPLVEEFHRSDPTRPVTQALFRPNVSHDYDDGLADMLDVVGQNYREREILAAHAAKPTRKIVGTETTHGRESWLPMRDNAEYSGQFLWSGTDYLGESRRWPFIGDESGFYDRTDRAKPDGLERESWWSETPVVHLSRRVAPTQKAPTDPGYEAEQYRPAQVVFADWSPADRGAHDENIEVYSNCESVELFLNGRSMGSKPRNADDSARKWTVPFEAGSLKAVGSNHGAVTASEELHTAGKPAKLLLTVERARLSAAWDDVAYVRAVVADADGTPVPDAAMPLLFSVHGSGMILATDNADNADPSGFQKPQRNAFKGTAIAIIRATAATGEVEVRVSAEGLQAATVHLPIQPAMKTEE